MGNDVGFNDLFNVGPFPEVSSPHLYILTIIYTWILLFLCADDIVRASSLGRDWFTSPRQVPRRQKVVNNLGQTWTSNTELVKEVL